jgi:perosamine synthetase
MPSPAMSQLVLRAILAVIGDAQRPVALHEPRFGAEESRAVQECLDSGWVSSAGPFVDRFEAAIAEFTGAPFAIAAVNGTAALHAALVLVGVAPGDEVLVPTLTFVATANAVSYCGAVPHLVDSNEDDLGIDAGRLADYLDAIAIIEGDRCVNRATGRTIRALVPMHTFGHPVAIDALLEIARRFRLALVEDAAESLGSWYQGRHTGRFGQYGVLSFNGNKTITTGGGGMLLTEEEGLARAARHLTTTAKRPHRWAFDHDRIGFNYRLPNINAALGCAQLSRLPELLARKRDLAARYADAFAGSGIRFVAEPAQTKSNYWLNTILLPPGSEEQRNEVLAAANEAGIMTRPIWTPMHLLQIYRDCPRMNLPVAESLYRRAVNLPSSAFL